MFREIGGQLKRALFEALVEEPETVAIPQEQLHAIAATIEKYIYLATGRIARERGGHKSREAIETFAHVGGMSIEKEAQRGREWYHAHAFVV
mgnify:CR=1 FL=1